MEVMGLVQYNLQIKLLTGHRAKGCQAAAIPVAFGNSDVTAGSKADLFLLGEELCFGISPPLPLFLISLLGMARLRWHYQHRAELASSQPWGSCWD